MVTPRHPVQLRDDEAGLSLVEVMVAMVVGLILLAGVISVFISSRGGYLDNSAGAQLQENGRFALHFIRNDTRMTGYMGCVTSATTVNFVAPADQLYNFELPVYGFEYNGTDPATATLTAPYVLTENPVAVAISSGWSPASDGSIGINAMPGSDVLVLYTSTGNPVYVTTPTSGGVIALTSSNSFTTGQMAVISSCVSSAVFQVSGVTPGSPGTITTPAAFAAAFQDGSQVLAADAVIYYVGEGVDKEPGLFRVDLSPVGTLGTPEELVPGVENMQVLYGVDATGGALGTPNQYLTAAQVDASNLWNDVLSIQIGMLLRSDLGALPLPAAAQRPIFDVAGSYIEAPQDTRLRRVFTTTIYLRNAPLPTGFATPGG